MNNQTIDVESTLNSLGYDLSDKGDYWQTNALFRNGDNKTALQIYKNSGVWKDYVNNTSFMPFKKLVQLTLNSNDDHLIDKFIKSKDLSFDNEVQFQKRELITMEKIYPDSMLERLLPHYVFYENRGISPEVLKLFKGGLCTEGKMYQRFVFPIFNIHGKIHGFSGRDMLEKENRPKWKHIGIKTKWIYPHLLSRPRISESKSVILVESIGDVLNLYQNNIFNVLCCFGVDISPSLISYLCSFEIDNIFISFNNDLNKPINAGKQGAVKSFFKLLNYFNFEKIRICLPLANDFGDMNEPEMNKWIEKKDEYSRSFDMNYYFSVLEYAKNKTNNPTKDFLKKIKKFETTLVNYE